MLAAASSDLSESLHEGVGLAIVCLPRDDKRSWSCIKETVAAGFGAFILLVVGSKRFNKIGLGADTMNHFEVIEN
jgi:hypothetical protein